MVTFLKRKTKGESSASAQTPTTASVTQDGRQRQSQAYPPPEGPPSGQQPPPKRGAAEFRPVVLSIVDEEWVHQVASRLRPCINSSKRILLIYGRAGPENVTFNGQIIVDHHNNSFPPQSFPVTGRSPQLLWLI